jgi:hypothetical protein
MPEDGGSYEREDNEEGPYLGRVPLNFGDPQRYTRVIRDFRGIVKAGTEQDDIPTSKEFLLKVAKKGPLKVKYERPG